MFRDRMLLSLSLARRLAGVEAGTVGILDPLAKSTRSCAIDIHPSRRAVPEQYGSESGRVGSDRARALYGS